MVGFTKSISILHLLTLLILLANVNRLAANDNNGCICLLFLNASYYLVLAFPLT